MNFKSVNVINENFIVDNAFNVFLVTRDGLGNEKQRVPLTSSAEKGYVYAALYFYDSVKREIDKLVKMINKCIEEVKLEYSNMELPIMLIEVSRRVRETIGEDSLVALIKEILAEEQKHIALVPDKSELDKYDVIREAIFTELMADFTALTFQKATDLGPYKTFSFPRDYIANLTVRQRGMLSPTLKIAGMFNQYRLDDFMMLPDFTVRYKLVPLSQAFDEESIKTSIKRFMDTHIK